MVAHFTSSMSSRLESVGSRSRLADQKLQLGDDARRKPVALQMGSRTACGHQRDFASGRPKGGCKIDPAVSTQKVGTPPESRLPLAFSSPKTKKTCPVVNTHSPLFHVAIFRIPQRPPRGFGFSSSKKIHHWFVWIFTAARLKKDLQRFILQHKA